ncbi:MAG: pseudouridine synthase [Bacteroidia bacterium]
MSREIKRSGDKNTRPKKSFGSPKDKSGNNSKKWESGKREGKSVSSSDEDAVKKRVKKEQKPAFERFRDDSRPSEFGTTKSRNTSGGDEERSKSSKPQFKKSNWDKDKKKPFDFNGKNKPFAKKEFGKKSGFKTKVKEANPYDLDESDFIGRDADNESKGFKTFGKKPSKKGANKSKESDGLMRLNKYIANAGICSRREADQLIATGVVQVNGKVITEMGFKIKPTDIIKYGGQTLKKERLVYLILNKPKDYITTVDDPQERRTVLELIQGACKERIYPVGRLDRATTGLLMFTNDGELTKKMTHPSYGVRKIYHVELDKPLKKSDLDKIADGVELEDGPIKVDEIAYVANGVDKTQVGVELHSGKNRIVRRIFESLGYNVRKLDRVMFGPLTKKDLPRGRWRFLSEAEVGMLKMISAS